MGQKVHPIGFRTGSFLPWRSRWFATGREASNFLIEDVKIREMLMKKLALAGVVSVEIERLSKSIVVGVAVSRPGVVIGRGGVGIEDVKKSILEVMAEHRGGVMPKNVKIEIPVREVKQPDLAAQLVLTRIISDLERRLPHRRSVTKAMERVMQAGALGVKIQLSGRIGGADISRVEKYHQGSMPAQTLRRVIDYAEAPASLKKGYVGIKVWIHKKPEE